MDIWPGRGIDLVAVGVSRPEALALLGPPTASSGARDFYTELDPSVIVDYGSGDTVELIEIAYSRTPDNEVMLDGLQLTFRLLDDVARDLASRGFVGRPTDIGFDYPQGFAIWSMGSLSASDLGLETDPDEECDVVEGVSVASPAYFGF